jgi:hypothetical protein
LQFSQAGQESQNCLGSEQNQTFNEFIKFEFRNICNLTCPCDFSDFPFS